MIIKPEVLIISNKFDFSTDLITNRLRELNKAYVRLNRDELGEYKIKLNPYLPELTAEIEDVVYNITGEQLKSIYYRAPTFLRDIFQNDLSEEEQLYRTQWAAFVRSLIVFDKVKWVNNPVSTYKAEMKPYQLYYANKVGFNVPETVISNYTDEHIVNSNMVAIKSIDTAILSQEDNEAFIYTTLLPRNELAEQTYSSPFFIQKGLIPKVDIRITVMEKEVIAVKIISDDEINEDWRTYKGIITYKLFSLPETVKQACLDLSKGLDLLFCAIDMVEFEGNYYFIEVNPTGEWSWLQKNTGYQFDAQITKILIGNE